MEGGRFRASSALVMWYWLESRTVIIFNVDPRQNKLTHCRFEKIISIFPNIVEMRLQEASLIKPTTVRLVEKLKLLQGIGLPPIATDADVEWLCTIPQAAAFQTVSLRGM